MSQETEIVEQRLKALQSQLQTEFGVLDRLLYKNKNQHRRCSYFQFLLKVRRDLRLLQSSKLEDTLNSCFLVINGKRPKQKVQLLESLKRKISDRSKPNFLDRLLGVARLLSKMVEPMLKAATEISMLLAQSFFMGFSLTMLSLLARIRVLVQQMLLDVVCIFNDVYSLSQREQAIQITEEGFEVFREYYPAKSETYITLECIWDKDKYVLVEKMKKSTRESQCEEIVEDVTVGAPTIQYQSIGILLGGDQPSTVDPDFHREVCDSSNHDTGASFSPLSPNSEEMRVEHTLQSAVPLNHDILQEGCLTSSSSPVSNLLKRKCVSNERVAFVSVRAPAFARLSNLDSNCEQVPDVG